MIVVMERGATREQVNEVVARVQELGLGAHLSDGEERTIIGVVPSLREQPTAEPLPAAFVPLTSAALANGVVLVRTEIDATAMAPVIRDEVRKLDPDVPVTGLMTLEDVSWRARWNSRVSSGIITTIALIALASLLAVMFAIVVGRSITRPVSRMRAAVQQIADGDLNARLDHAPHRYGQFVG